MTRLVACAVLLISSVIPLETAALAAEYFVVVPDGGRKNCVDLDSRWRVGSIMAWRQYTCGSDEEPVWVQTDCAQDFTRDGYWMATSVDGKSFSRKKNYGADMTGSSVALFVCTAKPR